MKEIALPQSDSTFFEPGCIYVYLDCRKHSFPAQNHKTSRVPAASLKWTLEGLQFLTFLLGPLF